MVALRDPSVSIGAASTSISNVTTVSDAALSAYSDIMRNRSKDWEGTVTLSGIYLGFMEFGSFTGGVPIRIHDSRYGMESYQARVKEVALDYENLTTTLTLNNYSEIYSNAVVDSSKMAYSAGDMSVEATSKDMFFRQYVFIDETQNNNYLMGDEAVVNILSETGYSEGVNADVIKFPELKIALVSAYFVKGVGTTKKRYGISKVRLNMSPIEINEHRRPDKYFNQSLIVNILLRIK